jgi:hypothetical protein
MAAFQYAGTGLDTADQVAAAPLVVLFERDDAIAVPLLAQIRMAQYDVRAARTPVELFDILSKQSVALVLVDLGNATAGRREFWVALDGQRRGSPTQVMTFRYSPRGSIFDTDFEPSARAIADVEISSAAEFELLLDGIRQRVPLGGKPNAHAPLAAPALAGPPLPNWGNAASPGNFPQSTFAVPQGYYSPPPASDPFAASPPFPVEGLPAMPMAAESGSPFAHPASVNPFAPAGDPSPFAHPISVNPFAAEATPPMPTPPAPPEAPAFAPAPAAPRPGGQGPQAPNGTPPDFEARAARLSDLYASQFGLNGNPGAPRPSVAEWGSASTPPAAAPAPFSAGGLRSERQMPDFSASDSAIQRAKAPIADAWTPPDADENGAALDLGGDTGVVPEMAYRPFSDVVAPAPRNAAPHVWQGGAASVPDSTVALQRAAPAPPSHLPAVQARPTETALGAVLIEGALLSPERLAALQGIQRLLANVNMDFRLGELALMFQFLSPDQLLAALLVSRGLVSPQQIAGLGRAKQELAATGIEYDLEELLTKFQILPAEKIRAVRAEMGG